MEGPSWFLNNPRKDDTRDLVKSDDTSILHHEIKPCGVNIDRHFIAKTLIENMYHYEGVGLSANQIGMDVRAFAMMI